MGITDDRIKSMVKKYFEDHSECGMIFVIPKTMSIFTSKKYADDYARRLGEKEVPLAFDRNTLNKNAKAERIEDEPTQEKTKKSKHK